MREKTKYWIYLKTNWINAWIKKFPFHLKMILYNFQLYRTKILGYNLLKQLRD